MALAADEHGWQAWCADIDGDLPHRDAVARSLLTLRLLTYPRRGRRSRHRPPRSRAPRRDPQLGLPLRLAPRRQHQHRRLPRRRQTRRGPPLPRLAAPRQPPGPAPTPGAAHPPRTPPPAERELTAGPATLTAARSASVTAPPTSTSSTATAGSLTAPGSSPRRPSAVCRDLAGHADFADQVAERWRQPDAGIWEIRGDGAHHVPPSSWPGSPSTVPCASRPPTRTPARQVTHWQTERDAIAASVIAAGYNPELGSYTRTYGSDDLDAAVLVLPLLDLEPRDSPPGPVHMSRAPPAQRRRPAVPLPARPRRPTRHRRSHCRCSFWLVEALATTGRVDEAAQLFDNLLDLTNPLGLLPEEINPTTHAYLGNYPQALTPPLLIQAALAIRDARDDRFPPGPDEIPVRASQTVQHLAGPGTAVISFIRARICKPHCASPCHASRPNPLGRASQLRVCEGTYCAAWRCIPAHRW